MTKCEPFILIAPSLIGQLPEDSIGSWKHPQNLRRLVWHACQDMSHIIVTHGFTPTRVRGRRTPRPHSGSVNTLRQ